MGLELMALADPFDCSMRSSDAGFDYFTHGADDPFESLFERYVSTDQFELDDNLAPSNDLFGAEPSSFASWPSPTMSDCEDAITAGTRASGSAGLQEAGHPADLHPSLRRATTPQADHAEHVNGPQGASDPTTLRTTPEPGVVEKWSGGPGGGDRPDTTRSAMVRGGRRTGPGQSVSCDDLLPSGVVGKTHIHATSLPPSSSSQVSTAAHPSRRRTPSSHPRAKRAHVSPASATKTSAAAAAAAAAAAVAIARRNPVISGRIRRTRTSPTATQSAVKMMHESLDEVDHVSHKWRTGLDLRNPGYGLPMTHHGLPISPPPSAKSSACEEMRPTINPSNYASANQYRQTEYPSYQDISPRDSFSGQLPTHYTPHDSPDATMHDPTLHRNNLSAESHYLPTATTTPYATEQRGPPTPSVPSVHQQLDEQWGTDNPHLGLDFASAPTDYTHPSEDHQQWWNFAAAEQASAVEQPSAGSQGYHQHISHDGAQQASKSLMHVTGTAFDEQSLATEGLMIDMPSAHHASHGQEGHDYYSASSTPHHLQDPFAATTQASLLPHLSSPALLPQSSSATSKKAKRSSGGDATRGPRNPSPIGKLSPKSKPSSNHRRHRSTPQALSHTPTRSMTASSASVPHTPTTSSNLGGFVNYTPVDAQKILHGVAPSGSSKTKARREKEAMEKKERWEREQKDKNRRLSAAVQKAIEEAGGSVESLSHVLDVDADV